MADVAEEIGFIILGMATGAFLFTLGNFVSFRFFKRLNEPLIKLVNDIILAIDGAIKGGKK